MQKPNRTLLIENATIGKIISAAFILILNALLYSFVVGCGSIIGLIVMIFLTSHGIFGLRKKAGTDDEVSALIDSDISRKAFRKNWARLIQKVYNVDPLVCPKCLGSMKIISLIDDSDVIKKILKHLGLWLSKRPPPPRAHVYPPLESPAGTCAHRLPGLSDSFYS